MEEMMSLSDEQTETGKPSDDSYLECGLPPFLQGVGSGNERGMEKDRFR